MVVSQKIKNSSVKEIQKAGENGIIGSLNNIGNIYYVQGEYPKALDKFVAGLKVCGEFGNNKGAARFLNNIGIIFKEQGNYPKALET